MVRGRFKYCASCLLLIACLALSNISRAANLITTDGVAVITSKIDKKLFRTRAIENALQNLVSQGSQTVDSFSIIENGKVLLDQVHLASKLGIQEYSVIKEEIKGKLYHVSLNVVVNDKQDKETNKKKSHFEINFATIIKVDEKIKEKKELEKIILCDVQIEIYPDLEKSLLDLLHNSGYPEIKFEKKINFEELYNQRLN